MGGTTVEESSPESSADSDDHDWRRVTHKKNLLNIQVRCIEILYETFVIKPANLLLFLTNNDWTENDYEYWTWDAEGIRANRKKPREYSVTVA